MNIYAHPTFDMAQRQFDLVADVLEIPENDRGWLKYPKRALTVACPVRLDDGSTRVFAGYRVQHHFALGPTKGGLRYHPDVTLGEVAALERQITAENAGQLRCRVLAEGANGPTTPEADEILNRRGDIFVVPDILCNAGGVVVSYFEWVQDLQSFFWSEGEVMDKLFRILEGAFQNTHQLAKKRNLPMRTAALSLGIKRVWEAKKSRGLFP